MKWQPGAWFWLLVSWLALLYVPDLGRGFLKDDVRWVAESRIASIRDVWHVLTVNLASYRW